MTRFKIMLKELAKLNAWWDNGAKHYISEDAFEVIFNPFVEYFQSYGEDGYQLAYDFIYLDAPTTDVEELYNKYFKGDRED